MAHSKSKLLSIFFDQWEAFFDELIRCFPGDVDFPRLKSYLRIGRAVNPKRVVTAVQKHMFPFENLVRSKNADFFLKYPFSEYEGKEDIQYVIQKVKALWFELSPNNQSVVLDYVIILVDLLHRYLAIP
jgi:hypothetical protein